MEKTNTLGILKENFWRKWHLNCVLKDRSTSYFSSKGRVIAEDVKERVLE